MVMAKASVSLRDTWEATAESRRGASHVRSGLPNQDSFRIWSAEDGSGDCMIAVADGHGSALHFRSDVGSRMAAEVSVRLLRELREEFRKTRDPEARRLAVERLPEELVTSWRAAIKGHLSDHPLTQDDYELVTSKSRDDSEKDLELLKQNELLPYGSTVLAALLTASYLLFVQLGDGDILGVTANGRTWRAIEHDSRLVANQTSSLCQPSAAADCRFRLITEPGQFPALVLLSTDGYANSFVSENDFLQIGKDYLDLVRGDGVAAVARQLPGFLDAASTRGSGDDITLGMAANAARLQAPIDPVDGEDDPMADQRILAELQEARTHLGALEHQLRSVRSLALAALLIAAIGAFGTIRPMLESKTVAAPPSKQVVAKPAPSDKQTGPVVTPPTPTPAKDDKPAASGTKKNSDKKASSAHSESPETGGGPGDSQ
jgi:serine/threonine protein phosphatase PrpC